MKHSWKWWMAFALAVMIMGTVGCRSTYYNTIEAFGYHKRDLLVTKVRQARDDQEEAQGQFISALEEFKAATGYQGGELEEIYNRLNRAYRRSAKKAEDVSNRIASVENVAGALFLEWEEELLEYSSAELRRASERRLDETRTRFGQLLEAMHKAEAKMHPVLDRFRDQVLFVKHNLNAQAIASLDGTVAALEADVEALLKELDASIAESDAFIRAMRL